MATTLPHLQARIEQLEAENAELRAQLPEPEVKETEAERLVQAVVDCATTANYMQERGTTAECVRVASHRLTEAKKNLLAYISDQESVIAGLRSDLTGMASKVNELTSDLDSALFPGH